MDAEKKTWHALSAEEAADALQGDLRRGLAPAEVRRRQEQFGLNELKEAPRRGFWRMLLDQFNQFLVIVLIVAAIVSALIGWREYNATGEITEFVDAGAIMAIVILNAILGLSKRGAPRKRLPRSRRWQHPMRRCYAMAAL